MIIYNRLVVKDSEEKNPFFNVICLKLNENSCIMSGTKYEPSDMGSKRKGLIRKILMRKVLNLKIGL